MKQVRETAAGKSISAYVVLRPDGTHVATVQFHFGNSGQVMMDVWHHGEDNPTSKAQDEARDWGRWRRPGGGGYDKRTACLAGVEIDGHMLTDHCKVRLPLPEGLDRFPAGMVAPPGYRLANPWRDAGGGWSDCYREPGLDYLTALGYRVIQAI